MIDRKEFKRKWVDALRSGKYVQTTGALTFIVQPGIKRFCCLGVACDLLQDVGEWVDEAFYYQEDYSGNYIPDSLLLELGITNEFQSKLVNLNDDDHYGFDAIANVIELEYEV